MRGRRSAPRHAHDPRRRRKPGVSRTLAGVAALSCLALAGSSAAQANAPAIRIVGNHFVDDQGQTIRLLGADGGPDLSDACVEPSYDSYRLGGVWGGPVDDRAVAAMAAWKMNAVRISLNEDCWLGINPVKRSTSKITLAGGRGAAALGRRVGRRYRSEVLAFVRRLNAAGMIAIIDLHWTAPGRTLAFDQWSMPDADHAVRLWRSVATAFRRDRSVVFDVFNEPIYTTPGTLNERLGWSCLRNGCRLPNACADCNSKIPANCTNCSPARGSFRAAGMQALVDAVRSTGATQPIMVPGRLYSNDLSRWLAYRPRDRLRQLAASFHNYEGLPCSNTQCWDSQIASVAAQVPVVTGEFGPKTWSADNPLVEPCDASFDTNYMAWADQHGVSYLAWSWYLDNFAGDNADRPKCTLNLLDQDWFSGTPRPGHGQAVHDHLAALSAAAGGGPVR